jgi:heme O synthase-like polyprenyltransferase
MLGLFVNWLAGALLAFTIFFYAVVYTMWLKRGRRRTSSSAAPPAPSRR